ncbi:MAG: glutathione-dependent formaldehyde dehydrogenase [Planctomycetes bacterium GWF2_42_9]|nr:MAG: glutathione-dependent formaldehyde dehydrogenase [Planctomycetes bacterium GWF2_42_9]HAL44710.1 glutathione-dependent formaldehyde dehydrogenase [Phycisphaerales bacterium]
MKALVYHGVHDVRIDEVPHPEIKDPTDAIIKVTLTAICGSDLHMYDGYIPMMKKGDILGHEFMGTVVETGAEVKKLKIGDKVVVPFPIACGHCFYCKNGMFSLCDNSNPNKKDAEKFYGYTAAGIYGYSHLFGGFPGGQAEYARVPYADVDTFKVPNEIPDEKVLFLSDIYPTGYMAADFCQIQPNQTIAVWGCGPVGQFAIRSCLMLGAERVIAIDRFPERLQMAKAAGPNVEVINYLKIKHITQNLREMTNGQGPDACIDAVGLEAHGKGISAKYDKVKQTIKLQTDRPTVLRETIQACRKGGIVSIVGVYGGFIDKMPIGSAFNKGLILRMGQTPVQKYIERLFETIVNGKIDPSFVITHRLHLEDAPRAYGIFKNKEDNCIKVVLKPWQ